VRHRSQRMGGPRWRSRVGCTTLALTTDLPNWRFWKKSQLLTVGAFVDQHPSGLGKTQGDEFQCHRAPALLAIRNFRRGLLIIIHGQISRPLKQALIGDQRGLCRDVPPGISMLVGFIFWRARCVGKPALAGHIVESKGWFGISTEGSNGNGKTDLRVSHSTRVEELRECVTCPSKIRSRHHR
jgi:hypothetical protein